MKTRNLKRYVQTVLDHWLSERSTTNLEFSMRSGSSEMMIRKLLLPCIGCMYHSSLVPCTGIFETVLRSMQLFLCSCSCPKKRNEEKVSPSTT
jgi:hypothetical protein